MALGLREGRRNGHVKGGSALNSNFEHGLCLKIILIYLVSLVSLASRVFKSIFMYAVFQNGGGVFIVELFGCSLCLREVSQTTFDDS